MIALLKVFGIIMLIESVTFIAAIALWFWFNKEDEDE
jgi:hypothetical protein